MSEEFESWLHDWIRVNNFTLAYRPLFEMTEAWQACSERKDVVIAQQAAELAALRGFAEIMKTTKFERMLDGRAADGFIKKTMALCKLIDENGKPTSLLTGVK